MVGYRGAVPAGEPSALRCVVRFTPGHRSAGRSRYPIPAEYHFAQVQRPAALHCDGSRYRAAADADSGSALHMDRASRDRAAPTRRALS